MGVMESIERMRDELQICETCGARPTIAAMSAYADEIEREHNEAAEKWFRKGLAYVSDELLDRLGLVRLHMDADGVPIHVGDVMAYEDNTKPTKVVALVPPAVFLTDDGPRYADMCRHYQPDTWERIIEDAAQFGHDSDVYNIDMEKFVARCKALAGEVSE